MQYAIYTNEKLRRVMVSLLCFLMIFLMANIVVQSIYVPRVDASAAGFAALLGPYALPILVLMLAIGGVVYADFDEDWQSQDVVSAFSGFVTGYYEDYMQQDILTFLESFQNNGSVKVGDVPVGVRRAFMDFAVQQANNISIDGQFGYENPYVTYVSATQTTGTLQVTDIPSYEGIGFSYEIDRLDSAGKVWASHNYSVSDTDGSAETFLDRWALIMWGEEASLSHGGELELQYYNRANGSYGIYHLYKGPFKIFNDPETGEFCRLVIAVGDHSVSIYLETQNGLEFYDVIFPQQDNPSRQTDFTGHTDIAMEVTRAALDITSAESGIILGDDVIDDGTEWREENEDALREEIVPPWTDVGTGTITIPVGGIGDITGEGVGVGDVTVPIDTSIDYSPDTDYPYSDTLIGDLPADIPLETDGTWTQKLIRPFTNVKTKFPFSLPWDIKNILDYFDSYEAQAPEYEFNLSEFYLPSVKGSIGFDKTLSLSLDFLDPYIPFIRFMEIVIADLILIMWLLRHFVSG